MKSLLQLALISSLIYLVSCERSGEKEVYKKGKLHELKKDLLGKPKELQYFLLNVIDDCSFKSSRDSVQFCKLVIEVANCAESKSSSAWEECSSAPMIADMILDTSDAIPMNKKLDLVVLLSFKAKHLTDQVQSAVRGRIKKGGSINEKNGLLLLPLFTERCRASFSTEIIKANRRITVPKSYIEYAKNSLLAVELLKVSNVNRESEQKYFQSLRHELAHKFFVIDYHAQFGVSVK